MITIKNTQFTSDISLADIMNVMTKVKMLDICKKLDLHVNPNLKKDETARRVARELQKFGLVLTYEDEVNQQWHMLMPDCVREAFAPKYQPYMEIAEKGAKLPSKKQICMMTALGRFLDGE